MRKFLFEVRDDGNGAREVGRFISEWEPLKGIPSALNIKKLCSKEKFLWTELQKHQ